MAFYFSKAFSDLSRSTGATGFISGIRRTAFTFMILGVIMLAATALQSALMEWAAANISQELKKQWFRALLRQDMAYFDAKSVAGEAALVSTNGRKVQSAYFQL